MHLYCMASPFSFSDSPGKNVRDGLAVMLGALLLMMLTAGEWLDAFFVSLWGIFVIIGFAMIVIGCARAVLAGFRRARKTPPTSRKRRPFFNALRHIFESHRKTAGSEGKPVSESLVVIWFLSCILGPPLGWLITSNIFFDLTEARAPYLISARVALTIPLPALAGVAIAVTYRAPIMIRAMFAVFVLSLSTLSVWSGLASAGDLFSGGVQSEVVTVAEYQPAGYFNAPWYDAKPGRDLNYGSYTARLADGRELNFYCTPVCLTHWSEKRNKEEWSGGKKVRMHYLPRQQLIVNFSEYP